MSTLTDKPTVTIWNRHRATTSIGLFLALVVAGAWSLFNHDIVPFLALEVFIGMVLRTRHCKFMGLESFIPSWLEIVLFPLWPALVVQHLDTWLEEGNTKPPIRMIIGGLVFIVIWLPVLMAINAVTDVDTMIISATAIAATATSVLMVTRSGDWYLLATLILVPWMRLI